MTGCAGAHNAQVLEVRVLSEREAAEYDFTDEDQGNRSCFPLFSPAQKALFEGDKYTLLSFTETATPQQGDKVACLVVRTDGAISTAASSRRAGEERRAQTTLSGSSVCPVGPIWISVPISGHTPQS